MQTTENSGGLRAELKTDVQNLKGTAAERVQTEADARKGQAASQVKAVSSALQSTASGLDGRDSPAWLKSAIEKGAQTLQQVADSLEQKDSRQLATEATRLARDNPGTFLAVSALAGFAAARVFKAGSPSPSTPTAPEIGTAPDYPAHGQAFYGSSAPSFESTHQSYAQEPEGSPSSPDGRSQIAGGLA